MSSDIIRPAAVLSLEPPPASSTSVLALSGIHDLYVARMATNDLPYVVATDAPFRPEDYDWLVDTISVWESRRSLTEIIAGYTNGSHPYFKYQASVLDLVTNGGE
ncbi:hypothetical protein EV421DRAFT_1917038 [Armillaria borealis]|uniref:Uncharacterized protein n=1 Tax=Armillaria borealis TaxID=47425 RepID=A0AA39IE51_9AGAR|nr:hypothetical protein EV421DRAFT_1917038 [Armillaria borealis]